ncbi:MAG: hypothetical protein EZS28_017576 [Streblomastix strix]|uniref:Uncharacterized protein n=1 Tax=Streblomastix strix TaxID=222440 RepID=A0A5J4VWH7_9EUKA|nr:MAG: hypothetical protein EZS28_017576 [Streblomastix strix]
MDQQNSQISVPSEYNIIGGLSELGEQVLLEILSEMIFVSDIIQFLGVCKKMSQLKNHSRFFKVIGTLTIGIVKEAYKIPENVHKDVYPHRYYMVSCGMKGHTYGTRSVYYNGNGTPGNSKYKNNQMIKIDYDSEKGTLIFFVEGGQQPIYVTGINEKVLFIEYTFVLGQIILYNSFIEKALIANIRLCKE